MSLLNKNPNIPASATEEDILKYNGFKTFDGRTFLALVGIEIQVFIRLTRTLPQGQIFEVAVTIYRPDRPASNMCFGDLAGAFGWINMALSYKNIRKKFTIPDWAVLE